MARKRKSYKKARTSKVSYFKMKRKRSSSSSNKVKLLQPDAMIYGAVRAPISKFVMENLAKLNLPFISTFGNAVDEVALGGINYFVAKSNFMPKIVKEVAKKGLIIENARVGELGSQLIMGAITPQANNNNSGYTIYG